MSQTLLISGPPGCGKTAWIARQAAIPRALSTAGQQAGPGGGEFA
jgi:HrpA-like RNA helicase